MSIVTPEEQQKQKSSVRRPADAIKDHRCRNLVAVIAPMHIFKPLLHIATMSATLLLCSCAFLPRSPDELRKAQSPTMKACAQVDPAEAAQRIYDGWRACHFTGPTPSTNQAVFTGKATIFLPTGDYPGDFIDIVPNGEMITVEKGGNSSKIGHVVQMLADIRRTGQCRAEITTWGIGLWSGRTKAVMHYIEHPDQGCEPK